MESRFNLENDEGAELVDYKSHISIRKDQVCKEKCENKPCTYICPSRVFYWEDESIKLLYKRCVECGACIWGCPYENIEWHYPRGGYGEFSIITNLHNFHSSVQGRV
ncbi:MAG: 4Fe-4S dicluster domain-containing protein [Halanaerobiales bacterium]|nr:4Fe-4S dicluster domain-containing protein [Halanaerobiales bacterium]